MAIVRTCDGNAPSEKPYRTPQPASRHAKTTLWKYPNRRIESTCVFGTRDDEVQLSPARGVPIANASVGHAIDPLCYPVIFDSFDSAQSIADEGQPPGNRVSNVRPQCIAVNTRDRVTQRRYGQSAKGSPQQRWRRHEAPGQVIATR